MNKKKKWIITAIVLVVFCLILGLYNLLNDKAPASDDAAKAPIAPRRQSTLNVNGRIVRPQRLTDGITTVGNLLPDEEVDLSFETSGKIVAINFQEGTVVRKGELLAKVNDLPLVAQLSRYEAQLKLADNQQLNSLFPFLFFFPFLNFDKTKSSIMINYHPSIIFYEFPTKIIERFF